MWLRGQLECDMLSEATGGHFKRENLGTWLCQVLWIEVFHLSLTSSQKYLNLLCFFTFCLTRPEKELWGGTAGKRGGIGPGGVTALPSPRGSATSRGEIQIRKIFIGPHLVSIYPFLTRRIKSKKWLRISSLESVPASPGITQPCMDKLHL